jgi:voltage-gated potassium channel
MLIISIFALALLAVQTFLKLSDVTQQTIRVVDTTLCVFFFSDFIFQVIKTRPVIGYLRWGWLDLLASIPMFPAFRLARLAWVARIIRLLRGARASRQVLAVLLIHRARNTFWAVATGCLVLVLFAAMAIVNVEPGLSSREAFWWSIFTLVTGDYGDLYPDTTEGRVIALLLMTAGVVLYGTFTATVASYFLEEEQEADEGRDLNILSRIDALSAKVDLLHNETDTEKKQ